MSLLDLSILSAGFFSLYKLATQKDPQPLNGSVESANKDVYDLDDAMFRYLETPVQSILLRCYAHDYTAPRMIANEELYRAAVSAANKAGAPCAWLQVVAIRSPNCNLDSAAQNMLKFCDDFVMKSGKSVDLVEMRRRAIDIGANKS